MSEKRRGGRTYSIRNIERMSFKYQWVERAEAWDLYLDRYRQLAVVVFALQQVIGDDRDTLLGGACRRKDASAAGCDLI
jgi:hypothetical protein